MRGIDSGRSARRVRSVFSVYSFRGGPDSPPVSSLFAASPRGRDRHIAGEERPRASERSSRSRSRMRHSSQEITNVSLSVRAHGARKKYVRSLRSFGRRTVVLLTITPSTPLERTTTAMAANSDSSRSGAIFRTSFGFSGSAEGVAPGASEGTRSSSRARVTP